MSHHRDWAPGIELAEAAGEPNELIIVDGLVRNTSTQCSCQVALIRSNTASLNRKAVSTPLTSAPGATPPGMTSVARVRVAAVSVPCPEIRLCPPMAF